MRSIIFLAAIPLMAQLDRTPPPNAGNSLARNAASVDAGQRRFQQLCASCHGRNGEGGEGEGQGPNLMNGWEVRRATDAQLFRAIKEGVKGTAMPAFALPDAQVWELAAFVRSLNAPASSVPVPGSAEAGQAIFFGKGGCSECHMIAGRGGYLGPDLSSIGETRRISELRAAVVNPNPIPAGGYRPLLLTAANGQQIRAIAKHCSTWSIEAIDEKGGLHLLHEPLTQKVVFQSRSWMPDDIARRLSPVEIDNLLAFLSLQTMGEIH